MLVPPALDVSRISGVARLEQQDSGLLGYGPVVDAPWNDAALAGLEDDVGRLPELDAEFAGMYDEEFVGVLVVVPDELAVGPGEFDGPPGEFTGEPW